MPIQSAPPYATGATTVPRTLYRWLDINYQNGPLQRTETYIVLPAFNVNYTWLGYSDIVASFNFEGPNNFSLLTSLQSLITVSKLNYLACISYIDITGSVVRYKLWQNVGEVLYFLIPLYTGQMIRKNFRFEVWSVGGSAQAGTNLLATESGNILATETGLPISI